MAQESLGTPLVSRNGRVRTRRRIFRPVSVAQHAGDIAARTAASRSNSPWPSAGPNFGPKLSETSQNTATLDGLTAIGNRCKAAQPETLPGLTPRARENSAKTMVVTTPIRDALAPSRKRAARDGHVPSEFNANDEVPQK